LNIGELTLQDILEALKKPGRDVREDIPKPIFRTDILTMEQLKHGMTLKGTVRNVIDFGAFVDLGVKRDGLIHISQMGERYIKHPLEVLSVGQVVEVKVIDVDIDRGRISLSLL
ncbi:MAG: S1 RNA-binding domain-containing protein, partial [Candidatus Eremiobacterota bacterium]